MKVKALFEYPVKGLRGSEISCASVSNRGLKMDRRWMIVDTENSFLSQRQIPQMANLLATFFEELKIEDVQDGKTISPPMAIFNNPQQVEVWGQVVEAMGASEEVNLWLSEKLGRSIKLVYMGEDNIRPIRGGEAGEVVSFADGYPLLLTGTASLADLNSRLERPVTIDRFRTNIHIETTEPFIEETWQRVRIGDVIFKVVKKCARCTVINVDQQSGKVHQEPLKTLSTYRQADNKVYFGMNLIPETYGLIHEGDKLEVIA